VVHAGEPDHDGKHCTPIFVKPDLASSDDDNRRVLAVLAHLNT
jgi:hypothetical protein